MFLILSCSCLCTINWIQVLSKEWRCSWSGADRRCSIYIWVDSVFPPVNITVMSHEHHGIFNGMRILWWPVNSLNKGPVMWISFLCHNVIMKLGSVTKQNKKTHNKSTWVSVIVSIYRYIPTLVFQYFLLSSASFYLTCSMGLAALHNSPIVLDLGLLLFQASQLVFLVSFFVVAH